MKFAFLCLFGFLASAIGLSLERIAELQSVGDVLTRLEHSGCSCFSHFCYCEAKEDGTKVGALIMVNEIHMHCHKCTKITAQFHVNDVKFEKNFPANRFEDFCKTVKGTRYCFRIDVVDHDKGNMLKGCLDMSRPKKMHIGCFNLPLMMTSTNDVIDEDSESGVTQEDETQYVDDSESNEELTFTPF